MPDSKQASATANVVSSQSSSYKKLYVDVVTGMGTGAFCAGLFNPWDRALYLSVKNNLPFLTKQNWKNPYQGVLQTVTQRSFSWGIYYILQGQANLHVYPYLRQKQMTEASSQFCVGFLAGSFTGAMTSCVSAVKYHVWGRENASFKVGFNEMLKQGGAKTFFKGTRATAVRDMVYGTVYEVTRHTLPTGNSKFNNLVASGAATIFSSPFNYVRNMHYAACPTKKTPSIAKVLLDLWIESKLHKQQQFGQLLFLQKRLRIGWGTLRVAVGGMVGQEVFNLSRNALSK